MPNYKRLKFFDKDAIEWTGNYELRDFYKTLLNLRKQNAALRAGDNNVVTHKLQTNANDKVFSFLRNSGNNEVLIILNFSSEQITVEIQDEKIQGNYQNVFDNSLINFNETKSINVLEWGYFVFAK
jgi:alpha-amylase